MKGLGEALDENRLLELVDALASLQERRRNLRRIEEMIGVELRLLMHKHGIGVVRTTRSEVRDIIHPQIICARHGIDPVECGCTGAIDIPNLDFPDPEYTFAARAIAGPPSFYAKRRKTA